MTHPTPAHAQIHWDANGQPVSAEFGDVYFSNHSGLDETQHNFILQNQLCERWQVLADGASFVIGETGFGTGLNFLCAWQQFEAHAPASARLHFVSVEKHPLSAADLAQATALWPSLAPQAQALLAQYRVLQPGYQRLCFAGGRVTLTLLIGDALEQFGQLDAVVDAWFLDGFAPLKNPAMWAPELFAQLARLSGPGTTIGTFCSAGEVRRALNGAGFKMRRVPGYGHKWEAMRGAFIGVPASAASGWYARPPAAPQRHALVVGAGLAGCASAASLAARGWRVTLLDRAAALAQGASGNPQGVLYLKLSAHGTALSRLIVSGFGYTRRLLEQLQPGEHWSACGVLQLAYDEPERQRQAKLAEAFSTDLLQALGREQAEARAGVALPSGGLYYPDAGWVHPPALCQWLAEHPLITFAPLREVLRLEHSEGQWQAFDGERCVGQAPVVVLANAEDAARLAGLPLKPIRGQITRLPANPASQALRSVVCADGYVAPPRCGEHTLGASFAFNTTSLAPSAAEHAENLERLAQISPELAASLAAPAESLQGRVAMRCTTPDYLPVVGPLAEADEHGQPRWREGLYVNSGHGSRGLITAPLAGELLAAWLCAEPLPLPLAVAQACHPNRFAARAAQRAAKARGPQSKPKRPT
ncbi:bifunctional tRNA (5-methylaminomethyl-2-thiouridine)(34)-methyltransferase MnmD/FAD-dependent 5-carboxymethylaminomethyl-2-thiouridine(34) oxidoreductase MnmC [Pseudomonas sp. NPDC007930]|uniref:bifunctional tRNA (5-methylaminomethyl-2-thiouridine)(34)-methyltransferase MnmD/FAD-dependent 5-carboxymethylaminomethyl-2-thiouridine(34) oxidoreductase MnmC n=1 Tax=Pseudomonas sp. NPDC007930 TaxID=3364417 RepID=UPI0036E35911